MNGIAKNIAGLKYSKLWGWGHSLWLLWTALPGLSGIAFFYIGLRVRQKKWALFGILYSIPFFVPNELFNNNNFVFWAVVLIWITAFVHALRIRAKYLELLIEKKGVRQRSDQKSEHAGSQPINQEATVTTQVETHQTNRANAQSECEHKSESLTSVSNEEENEMNDSGYPRIDNENSKTRAFLLSDYAKSFLVESQQEKGGFWIRLKSICQSQSNHMEISLGTIDKDKNEGEYVAEGFIPFCSIGTTRVLVRPSENKREIICLDNESVIDLSAVSSMTCGAIILSALYIYAIADDYTISKDESQVIGALMKCLQPPTATISQAKQFVFLSILHNFLNDNSVTEDEILSIAKVAKALELNSEDISFMDADIFEIVNNIKAIFKSNRTDDLIISDLRKELVHLETRIANYRRLLNSSGLYNKHIRDEVINLMEGIISNYYQLLTVKSNLSRADVDDFIRHASRSGIQQEKLKSYIDTLNETLRDNAFEQKCQKGELTPVGNPPVILKKNETAYYVTTALVTEIATQTKTHRLYSGTRFKLGNLPIYFGGSTPVTTSKEHMKTYGEAYFVITDKRIVISGEKVSYGIPLDSLINFVIYEDAIQLRHEGRYNGRGYVMKEPKRAGLILNTLISQHAVTKNIA